MSKQDTSTNVTGINVTGTGAFEGVHPVPGDDGAHSTGGVPPNNLLTTLNNLLTYLVMMAHIPPGGFHLTKYIIA